MVGKEMQSGGSKKLAEIDAKLDEVNCYNDVLLAGVEILRTAKQLLSRTEEGEPEYMSFLLHVLAKGESVALGRKRKEREDSVSERGNDYYGEEVNDPQYESFLKCLSEHEKSYMLKCETGEYKYEEHTHLESDEECDLEPQRKLRSAMNQPIGLSSQMAGFRNQYEHDSQSPETMNMTGRMTKSKSKIKNVGAGKTISNELVLSLDHPICQTARVEDKGKAIGKCDRGPAMKWIRDLTSRDVTGNLKGRELRNNTTNAKARNSLADERPDPDYEYFQQHSQVINGRCVYTDDGTVVVYEKSDDDENKQLSDDVDDDDESNSDVEIIDHDMFHNAVNLFPSTAVSTEGFHDMNKTSKFQEQLINLLRKPYCEKEHEKLLQEVELRKPVAKHIELRNGRERSGSKHIDGKSYLDHYPDFERKLLLNQGHKAKCLNLLRGFFFWLQKFEQHGSFQPWTMNSLV